MINQQKPVAKLIKAQIEALDEDEQVAQEAAKAASARRAKQKAQLLELLDAVVCEGMTPQELRTWSLVNRNKKK
jgi:hypothetical protein